MDPNFHKERRQLRSQLLRRCGFWGMVLPLLVFVLSILIADSPDARILFSALGVAAGFTAAASGAGPAQGIAAAFLILIGALLGSIAFSAAIAFTVAMIGIAKLRRLDGTYKN